MAPLAYDDLPPGRVFDLGTVVVDREEMLAFNRRFDPQSFHVDERAAQDSIFGGLCASGWFTAALWMRCYVDAVLTRALSLGSPGGRELSWPAPVFPGDELHAQLEVLDGRVSRSRPSMGLVELLATMHRGEVCVLRAVFTGLFGVREPDQRAGPSSESTTSR